MARAIYNGIEVQDLRTYSIAIDPEYDEMSGVDFMRTHVVVDFAGVFNPLSTASNIAGGFGDRAGLSLVNLRQALITPRRQFQFFIGPDLVFLSPPVSAANAAVLENADPNFGPKVISCRCTEIVGDKSIIVQWRGEFWVMGTSNIVLSNRWTCTHSISRSGMTTRKVHGRCVVRADAITQGNINNADDFRSALILPLENNFRRDHVDVVVSADGTEAEYSVTDKETSISLGANAPAYRIEGYATGGFDTKIKDFKQEAVAFAEVLKLGFAGDFAGAFVKVADAVIPVSKGRAMCRVFGDRTASRSTLAQFALNVCLDRAMSPSVLAQGALLGQSFLTSVYITQDLAPEEDGQVIECRIEWFVNFANINNIANAFDASKTMNLANNYTTQGLNLINSVVAPQPNPPLPFDGGTRGQYVGACMVQGITAVTGAPAATPQAIPNVNVPVGGIQ